MRKALLYVICLLLAFSCKRKISSTANQNKPDKYQLIEVDKSFSELSAQKGMKAAFIEYIDSNGIMLRPRMLPIAGANAIDYLISQNDSDYSLTWVPRGAAIANSGEMGFTYGYYTLQPKSGDSAVMGTYVTIWKKQNDGSWKFVLDSGNEGLGEVILDN